jgi:S-formylglutathione hydrolase FrmB
MSQMSVVKRLSFASTALGRDWSYIVYAPSDGSRPCPVVYLLHGNYGSPEDFIAAGELQQTADRLIAEGRMPPVVIAMPDGASSWYLDHETTRMETALVTEFMPRIEATEPVITDRAGRFIGGISMGGYGALRQALRRPELFAAVALMSPAIYADLPHAGSSAWSGRPFCVAGPSGELAFEPALWRREAYPCFIDAYVAKARPLRFYVESGAQDEFGIAEEARRLYECLRERGQRARFGLRDGTHDWPTWKAALAVALPFLLSGRDETDETPVA